MKSPDYLSLSDVEELFARLGVPAAWQNLARGLREFPLSGVDPPRGNGQAWRVRPHALLDLLSVVLWRRERRRQAPRGVEPGSPHRFQLDAAERLMADRELARLVPRGLAKRVRERREARRRQREERARWLDQLVWGKHRAEEEARRRRREAEARERLLDDAYTVCRRQAMRDYGVTLGPGWLERPENQPFLRDWPSGTRPGWWAPPPGLLEVVAVETPKSCLPGYQPPDWARWVPKCGPCRPWPWRKPDLDSAAEGDAVPA